jgi:hypothetical protein
MSIMRVAGLARNRLLMRVGNRTGKGMHVAAPQIYDYSNLVVLRTIYLHSRNSGRLLNTIELLTSEKPIL